MIGLKKQIEARRIGIQIGTKEPISYSNVAKIINKSYHTAKRKIDNGSFTVKEAIDIYNGLNFRSKSKFDAFEYLFTEQGDE